MATIDADGNWAYTPNANFNGPDSFTVLVTDDLGNIESQVINVTVEAVADLSAADDAASVDEDGVLEASVADNDSTISGGALTYALAAGATTANGELLFNEDGSYTYTPNTDYYGPDSFSYVVTDAASGESSTQTVTITVNPAVEANSITIDAIEGDSGVADDFQTNDTTLTVSGSLANAIASDERVEISTDGGATWTTATVDGTNWSFEDPTAQDASFTYEARIAGPGDSVGATAEQAITIDTTPPVATIQLDDAVTSDNIINAQESGEAITISGSVGGDVRAGDTVTLTVNGVQSQGVVESVEGALRFSAEVQGADLVADGDLTIDAAITTTDDAGNISEVATDVQTYTVDLEAFATITVEVLPELEGVALENAIAVAAYRGDTLNVTGIAGLDAADGGEITLTVNGNVYTGTVDEEGTYSIAVAAADLVDAESAEGTTRAISVTVEASDEAGNPATASAETDVLVRPVQQTQLTDNFVDGVSYTTTSGLSGTTGTNESTGEAGAQGSFLYRAGDTITLTLGSVIIAEFSADQVQGDVLFLQDIAGVALSDVNNEYVENMAIFLQALDADANPDNGIQITPETAAFFEGYTDAGTGEALNLATAGKQMLANALSAADEFTPEGFVFTAVSETDPVQEDGSQNVFETEALDHVAETIEDLSGVRDPEVFDERTPDTIDVPGGIIDYNFNFDAGQNGEITFTRDDLLVGAVPQQVTYDNLEVSEVALSEGFTEIGELTFDEATGVYTIALNEGITRADVSGLTVDYQVRDWTAVVDAVATTLDESALTAVDDTAQGDEDTAILGSVADNDTTTSGGTLSYAINTDLFVKENEDGSFTLSQGVLTLDPEFSQNGQYSFQPNENYNGTDSFSYTVTDSGSGERAVQTVTITVDAVNDVPVILDADSEGFVTELSDTAGDTSSGTTTVTGTTTTGTTTITGTTTTDTATITETTTTAATTLTDTGTITFEDVDLLDTHTATVTGSVTNAAGEAVRGQLTLGAVDNTEDQFGGLGWTYSVEDGALDDLSEGETRVETFTVALDDGNGGVVEQDVVITITGTDDVAGTDEQSNGPTIAPVASYVDPATATDTAVGTLLYDAGGAGEPTDKVTFAYVLTDTNDKVPVSAPDVYWVSNDGLVFGDVVWTVSPDDNTVTGTVGVTTVLTVALTDNDENYQATVSASGTYYSDTVFTGGNILSAGNGETVRVENIGGSTIDAILSTPDTGNNGRSLGVNTTNVDIGVGSQWINPGETLKIDFLDGANIAQIDQLGFSIHQLQGNAGNVDVDVKIFYIDSEGIQQDTTVLFRNLPEGSISEVSLTNLPDGALGITGIELKNVDPSASFGLSINQLNAVVADDLLNFEVTAYDSASLTDTGTITIGLDQDDVLGVIVGATVIDGVVAGMNFTTSSGLSGSTDMQGRFQYSLNDSVTFSIGNVVLGTVSAASAMADGKLFLQEIAGVGLENITDDYVEKLAIFLQTLDNDGDAYNGIVITDEMHALFSDDNFDLEAITKEELVQLLLDNGLTPVDEDEAIQHVKDMITEHAGVTEFEEDDNDSISLLGDDEGLDLAWSLADSEEPVDGMYLSEEADQVSLEIGDLLGDGIPDSDLSQYISVASDGLNTVIEVNSAGIGNTGGGASMSYTLEGVDLTTDTNGNALDTDSMNELLRNLYNGANDTGLM